MSQHKLTNTTQIIKKNGQGKKTQMNKINIGFCPL